MANATVEKLKKLGIRHGEKAVVALSATLCVLFLSKAFVFSKAPTDLTPEKIKAEADSAQQNINKQHPPETIVAKLEEEGLKNPDFKTLVEDEDANKMRPEKFVMAQGWTSQEPGAGLIRETPILVAPRDLEGRPNRTGLILWETDAAGEPIPKTAEDYEKEAKEREKARKKGGGGGMSGGSGGYGGEMGGYGGGTGNPLSGKAKQDADRQKSIEANKLKRSFAGKGALKAEEKATPAAETIDTNFKEKTVGRRSVALTAILDHKQLRENYAKALKLDPSQAHPKYLRVDLERQRLDQGGRWSDWTLVDRSVNEQILKVIAQREEEFAKADAILEKLVDNLPFLKAGFWQGVHRREFVAKEKQTLEPPPGAQGGMAGMPGGSGGCGGMMGGYGGEMGGYGGMMGGRGGSGGEGEYGGGYGGMMGGYGGMMGGYGGGGGGGDVIDFPTSQASELMVRAIDFTVDYDATYRYRARIVVANPNYKREMIAADVDTAAKELSGPFSEPTSEIYVPTDVTAYITKKVPTAEGGVDPRTDKLEFRLAKWIEEDGQLAIIARNYGAGQIIGDVREPVRIPTDGEGINTEKKDMTSHQLIVDTFSQSKAASPLGVPGAVEIPPQALILRVDGSFQLRDQVRDAADQENRDVYTAYSQALKDAIDMKKRQPGMYGGGYGGEMGGMDGEMGGGYGGGYGGGGGGRR